MSKQGDLVSVSQGSGGDPLHIDTTNDRLGLGTTSPAQTLDVSGSMAVSDATTATKRLQIDSGANSHTIHSANYGSDMMDLNIEAENLIFNTGLVSVVERMRIDSLGRVSKPHQPAFDVSGSNSHSAVSVINWSNVKSNQGSHYNTTNGRFTAPVSGYYTFSITVGSSSSYAADVQKNGSSYRRVEHINPPGFSWGTTSVVMHLSVNDYVDCNVVTGTVAANSPFGGFSGYFLG